VVAQRASMLPRNSVGVERLPNQRTIFLFQHAMEQHKLTEKILQPVNRLIAAKSP
jgi:hypothetical protein